MKNLQINTKSYTICSSFDELTPMQFLRICHIRTLHPNPTDMVELQSLKIQAFYILTDAPMSRLKNADPEQWVDLLKTVEFLFNIPVFSKNPIPEIHISMFSMLVGPIGMMSTTSFAEFMGADNAFLSYHKEKNQQAAWLLLATLWRPKRQDLNEFKLSKDWNTDQREPYNEHKARELAKTLQKKLPPRFATAALLYYEGVRNRALINNPRLKILFKGSGGKHNSLGWMETLLESSGKKFGDFNETADTNWLLIIVDLARELEKAPKQQ